LTVGQATTLQVQHCRSEKGESDPNCPDPKPGKSPSQNEAYQHAQREQDEDGTQCAPPDFWPEASDFPAGTSRGQTQVSQSTPSSWENDGP
jgi:hypothetical protein